MNERLRSRLRTGDVQRKPVQLRARREGPRGRLGRLARQLAVGFAWPAGRFGLRESDNRVFKQEGYMWSALEDDCCKCGARVRRGRREAEDDPKGHGRVREAAGDPLNSLLPTPPVSIPRPRFSNGFC